MKKIFIFTSVVAFLSCLIWIIYYIGYDLERIHPRGEKLIAEETSPNRKYEVKVFLSSGGATLPWSLRGVVKDLTQNKQRVIYWNEGKKAVISWVNNTTVKINGKKINVIIEKYDYRHDN